MHKTEIKRETCPAEHTLNAYLTGTLLETEREAIEKHLADCPRCIYRIAEADAVVRECAGTTAMEVCMKALKKINIWFLLAIVMFLLSFIVPRYFMQFLVGALIFAAKWIVDNRNTKMLIMIYDAWKRGGQEEAGKIISSLEDRMKRR